MTQQDLTRSVFSVTYEGEALQNNTIRVRDLAPALMAMDDLFQRANVLLNGDNTSAALNIRAQSPGSYEVEFMLEVFPLAVGILGSEGLTSAANLVRLLFGSQHGGLFTLLKLLRGQSPNVVGSSEDRLIIEYESTRDGETDYRRVEASGSALRLLEDTEVRRTAFGTLKPLNRSGINQMAIREGNEEIELIVEEDLPSFSIPSQEGFIREDISRQFLTVATVRLTQKSRRWQFNDGSKNNWYTMRDEEFIALVAGGGLSFTAGDVFDCDVRRIQSWTSKGALKTEFEISRVYGRQTPPSEGIQGEFII